jgi:hypothetical protein
MIRAINRHWVYSVEEVVAGGGGERHAAAIGEFQRTEVSLQLPSLDHQ